MTRHSAETLRATLTTLFQENGATPDVAEITARILVEGDLLGHHTHGVKLANGYLKDLKAGHACGDHTQLNIQETVRLPPCSTAITYWVLIWSSVPWIIAGARPRASVSVWSASNALTTLPAWLPTWRLWSTMAWFRSS